MNTSILDKIRMPILNHTDLDASWQKVFWLDVQFVWETISYLFQEGVL